MMTKSVFSPKSAVDDLAVMRELEMEDRPGERTHSEPMMGRAKRPEMPTGGFSFPVSSTPPRAVQADAPIFKSWASTRSSFSGLLLGQSDDENTNATEYADDGQEPDPNDPGGLPPTIWEEVHPDVPIPILIATPSSLPTDYQSYLSSREPSQRRGFSFQPGDQEADPDDPLFHLKAHPDYQSYLSSREPSQGRGFSSFHPADQEANPNDPLFNLKARVQEEHHTRLGGGKGPSQASLPGASSSSSPVAQAGGQAGVGGNSTATPGSAAPSPGGGGGGEGEAPLVGEVLELGMVGAEDVFVRERPEGLLGTDTQPASEEDVEAEVMESMLSSLGHIEASSDPAQHSSADAADEGLPPQQAVEAVDDPLGVVFESSLRLCATTLATSSDSPSKQEEEPSSPANSATSQAMRPSYTVDANGAVIFDYDLSYIDRKYEVFDLRIIHRRQRTGFEETKDFPIRLNDLIAGRYQVVDFLGSAAFSRAVQALDVKTGTLVCLKIIKNNKDYLDQSLDEIKLLKYANSMKPTCTHNNKDYLDQSLDEIKLLKYVNSMDPSDAHGLVRLYDYFYYKEHLFLVCELLRANLYEFQKYNRESSDDPYFTNARIQKIATSALRSLAFMHSLNLIHSDLKPENILIKSYSRCEVKVIDLGSSCFVTDQLSSYVQSRSYRAPEVILGLPYDQKVDIWSLGCILAELSSGYVLFQNDSLSTLLARLEGLLGPVPSWMVKKGRYSKRFYTRSGQIYERSTHTGRYEVLTPKCAGMRHRMPEADKGLLSFVTHLLSVDPRARPTAAEALSHPWLQQQYPNLDSNEVAPTAPLHVSEL
eukprot:gene20443-27232_t